MILKIKGEVIIETGSPTLTKAIFKGIEPENRHPPQNMIIESVINKNSLIIKIIDEKKDLLRTKNTIEDIIESVDIVINALEGSK